MSKVIRTLLFILFGIGALFGMTLAAATTIANLEADFYFGFSYQGDESLKNLDCPVILSGDEVGTVAVTLSNPNEKEIEPLFQVEIGNMGLFRSYRDRMFIPAGESQTLQWTVSRDDVVFNHLILVKLFQFAAFKTPTRDGSCGIVYLDLPFSGNQVLVSTIAISLAGMGLAILLWLALDKIQSDYKARLTRAMLVMAGCVTAALVTGVLGVWLLGVLFFMVSLLLIAEVVRSFTATA
ncbi:MAG: hypothetical protein FJZ96_01295 [Chloroflexi bacterium]|nr:hypothetical protein [Chloroflexota bacterium]